LTGPELRAWRKANGYATQESLQRELGVKSRGTISAWEQADVRLPRLVELALTALERVPNCRMIGGAHRDIASRRNEAASD
jgi:transcriptional regulator with XRE-family HTH domain